MRGAFFQADGDHYVPSELTRGPWDPDSQHAGPPAGLLGREIERCEARENASIARITFEILRPVPIAPLRVSAKVTRPGRSVELIDGSLSDARSEVMRARAWRIRTTPVDLPADVGIRGTPPPGPEAGTPAPFFPTGSEIGYHTAMEYRFIHGTFLEPGPATVWMRMRHPLIEGELPSPLQRVLVAADSGNGVSAVLDWSRYLFINTDLTVHLHRYPQGEWVCLDAVTIPETSGIGLADTALSDQRGPIGRALQSLLVGERD